MLSRLFGSVADEAVERAVVVDVAGRVTPGRVAELEVGRALGVVAEVSLPTGRLVEGAARDVAVEEVAGFLSKADPATLDLRSTVDVDFNGARVEVVPAIDIRLAVVDMPRFSSPELAIDRGFSSAELLIDARER